MKKPYITLEEALAAREEGRRSVKFLMDVSMAVVQELQYVQKQSLIQNQDFMMTRRDFLYWKEMDLSGLTTKSLRLKRVIHL